MDPGRRPNNATSMPRESRDPLVQAPCPLSIHATRARATNPSVFEHNEESFIMEPQHQLTRDSRARAGSPLPGVNSPGSVAVGLDSLSRPTDPKPLTMAPVRTTSGGGNGQCEAVNGQTRKGRASK